MSMKKADYIAALPKKYPGIETKYRLKDCLKSELVHALKTGVLPNSRKYSSNTNPKSKANTKSNTKANTRSNTQKNQTRSNNDKKRNHKKNTCCL